MDPKSDIERLNAVLTEIGERAARDTAYRDELMGNQVEALRSAGASALMLGGVFEELGAEAEEVAAYGMELMSPSGGDDGGTRLIVSQTCIGTCRKQTFWICGGCKNSILTSP